MQIPPHTPFSKLPTLISNTSAASSNSTPSLRNLESPVPEKPREKPPRETVAPRRCRWLRLSHARGSRAHVGSPARIYGALRGERGASCPRRLADDIIGAAGISASARIWRAAAKSPRLPRARPFSGPSRRSRPRFFRRRTSPRAGPRDNSRRAA